MKLNNCEIKKLFDFILMNKVIKLSDDSLFNRDTLIMLRDIIKGKKKNNFELSKEDENTLINVFIEKNLHFDNDTPNFILSNLDCIDVSIERDINSVKYTTNFTPELEKKLLDLAIKNKYILNSNSPYILKKNYDIALFSIRLDVSSADYVEWSMMKDEEFDNLIDETIKQGYILSSKSCYTLKNNPDIVFNSISKKFETLYYADPSIKDSPKVFKYLVSNHYEFTKKELINKDLSCFADIETMKYALYKFGFFDEEYHSFYLLSKKFTDSDINNYIERFSNLLANSIKEIPKINSLKSVLQYNVDVEWEDYKISNLDELANIFGKICAELQASDNFDDALNNLNFLKNMKKTLDDKYNLLIEAMKKYHTIIHSEQNVYNIDFARDEIAKLSAMYVSVAKENFKKELLKKYEKELKKYFIPMKNHPIVYKKIIENRQKNAMKTLFLKKDKNTYEFLKKIVKQYDSDIDKDELWQIIKNFISNGYSKLDSFIKAPSGFNDYKRYEEASKLVNRLNSKYIKYTDKELTRYLDIIKYDKNIDKYYYIGPTFDFEQVSKYNAYSKKQKIFDKIKQQIIFKAKTLEIDEKITREELLELKKDLPFTDEYYEFDKLYFEEQFTLQNFIHRCINNIIKPHSILNDEVYDTVCNYVIDNGLIWILLFFGESDYCCDCFDKKNLFKTLDLMEKIVRISKKFNYDVKKYNDVVLLEKLSYCTSDETIAILGKETIERLYASKNLAYCDFEKIFKISKQLICQMVKKNYSTVPYIKGKTMNYEYCLYDSQDNDLLFAGTDTNACFKVNGVDNDFLHYCALDKNGFVIKISDCLGNFIARASGFRNGNSVYINQLRSIYDYGSYDYYYEKEKNEIIETFQKACNDIITISQNNKEEKDKIDFVFVTKSYAMQDVKTNIGGDVINKIGSTPMISNTKDWENFVKNTKNLTKCSIKSGFTTDYGNYSLICVAYNKKIRFFGTIKPEDIKPKDIKSKDVAAVYARPRNSIIVTDKITDKILNKVNKINGINSYLSNTQFEFVSIPTGSTLFVGDNWYITYLNGKIVNSIVLEFDKRAQLEYEIAKKTLEEYTVNNEEKLDLDKVSQKFSSNNQKDYAKVLRLNH